MLAHFYTIQPQLASNFLFYVTPTENILKVALAPESIKSDVAIYRFSKVFFVDMIRVEGEKNKEKRNLD